MIYHEEAVKLPFGNNAKEVTIEGGRVIKFNVFPAYDIGKVINAIAGHYNIEPSTLESLDADFSDMEKLDAFMVLFHILFGVSLYDGHYELETPRIRLKSAEPDAIINYGKSVMDEMSDYPGSLMFNYIDVLRIGMASLNKQALDLKNV